MRRRDLTGMLILHLVLALGWRSPAAAQETQCDAPELVAGNAHYNELVCHAVDLVRRQDYANAVEVLEGAMRMTLYDSPNFRLYPLLALAYWRGGDSVRAKENLEKARLSVLVLTGVYRCEESRSGGLLLGSYGKTVGDRRAVEVSRRMCGAAYEDLYRFTPVLELEWERSFELAWLKGLVAKARLIERYLLAEQEVSSSERQPR